METFKNLHFTIEKTFKNDNEKFIINGKLTNQLFLMIVTLFLNRKTVNIAIF